MKRIIGLAGLMAFCMLLSTCGTYRAIIDDYEPDYIIRDIKPLSGVSGQQVTFDAQICATAGSLPIDTTENPPNFIWRFGGGADPDVSYDAKPVVMLRAGSTEPYQGSLTVRDGCLQENVVSATFDLNIMPLTVFGVTPRTGVPGGSATFSVIVGSGNATAYAWDFGGAVSSGNTSVASPSVTFSTTAAGTYDCNVIVSNDYELAQYLFTLAFP